MSDFDSEPMVIMIQRQAWDGTSPVSRLLRLAKAIAVKLDISSALSWIERELNGYPNIDAEDFPAYRVIVGEWEGLAPNGYWSSIAFNSDSEKAAASIAQVPSAVGELELAVQTCGQNGIPFSGDGAFRRLIINTAPIVNARMRFAPVQVAGILDRVRNVVLDWALELEQVGVLGENYRFSVGEKAEASASLTTFNFIQNAGVVGHVNGGAISNHQQANLTGARRR